MLKRIWKTPSWSHRHDAGSRAFAGRLRRILLLEVLEARQLLTASLGTISNITVPAQLGYQVSLNGSGTTSPTQTFQATSSNPDISVSVAQGEFWTFNVNHVPANSSDITITNEKMTFQLFKDLTPNTYSRITTQLITPTDNYYTQGFPSQTPPVLPGQYIPRITNVAGSGFSAIQGGSSSATDTRSSSGITPIATEPVQQLAFTGTNQLAMANTGMPDSTDAQFFITNGVPSASTQQAFDFNYTIVGQLVSGQQTVTDLSKVAVQPNSGGENSQPITPVTISGATLSSQNPNGVLHINTNSAKAGETATITVTATDPSDHTTATQTFTVTVGAYNGPSNPVINFIPFASPVTVTPAANTPTTVQLKGQSGFPNSSSPVTLSYKLLSQPAHGTITQFNSSTGSLVYTPNKGYLGADSFQYEVLSTGPNSSPATTTSTPATVSLTVGQGSTGAVRLIGTSPNQVLVVDPIPNNIHFTNVIHVSQVANPTTGGDMIQVSVNGLLDSIQPATSALTQIIVFGSKSSDQITVDPSVTVPTTLNGGTGGGKNIINGGGGPTLENGWFGHNVLIGGVGANELIGRKGHVRFQPSSTTTLAYVGNASPAKSKHHPVPPGGIYYRFVKGHLVRVK